MIATFCALQTFVNTPFPAARIHKLEARLDELNATIAVVASTVAGGGGSGSVPLKEYEAWKDSVERRLEFLNPPLVPPPATPPPPSPPAILIVKDKLECMLDAKTHTGGSKWVDLTANGKDGTIKGSLPYDEQTGGRPGFMFAGKSGNSDGVLFDSPVFSPSGPYSLGMWLYRTGDASSNECQVGIGFEPVDVDRACVRLAVQHARAAPCVDARGIDAGRLLAASQSTTLPLSRI